MRTRTGNAVILRLSPTKSANGHTSWSGTPNCVLTAIASPMPSTNGSTMLAMLVKTTSRPARAEVCQVESEAHDEHEQTRARTG
jgi:hypothetical protein